MPLQKKYVVITGASAGIGRALAGQYASEGYSLVLVARRLEMLNALKLALETRFKISVYVLAADVADADFVEKLRTFLQASLPEGRLSYVYANAGIGGAGKFAKLGVEVFERNLAVNVIGVVKTLKACDEKLREASGRAVIIGSLNSYLALPLGSPYNTGKFAVRGLADTLYAERATLGYNVSLVCPGPVTTDILYTNNKGQRVTPEKEIKIQGALSPEEAAYRISKKAARGQREIFLNFGSGSVVWLFRVFPGSMQWLVRKGFAWKRDFFMRLIGAVNPDAV